jgi:hypothetical protein
LCWIMNGKKIHILINESGLACHCCDCTVSMFAARDWLTDEPEAWSNFRPESIMYN